LRRDRKDYSTRDFNELTDIYIKRLHKEKHSQSLAIWNYYKTHDNNTTTVICDVFGITIARCNYVLDSFITNKKATK
jgi:hypothetical protein